MDPLLYTKTPEKHKKLPKIPKDIFSYLLSEKNFKNTKLRKKLFPSKSICERKKSNLRFLQKNHKKPVNIIIVIFNIYAHYMYKIHT